jgi:hypothetical protein
MPDELNTPNHRYYQPRYNIALAKEDMSKQFIFASGIRKIDSWIDQLETQGILNSIFANNEPGFLTTISPEFCFADTAGTTPATIGGTVAYVADRSGNGNHWTQATSASRPILGRKPVGGIRNRATGAAAVTNTTYWPTPATSNGVTRTLVATGVDGGEYWVEYRFQGTPTISSNFLGYASLLSRTPAAIGQTWTGSARLQVVAGDASSINVMRIQIFEETAPSTVLGITSGDGVPTDGTENLAIASRTLTAGDQVRVGASILFNTGAAVDVTVRVRGLQFEQAATRSAYQANFGPFDITEAGKANRHYLYGGGSADPRWMITPTITPGTDKAQVFAGVRKLSDSAFGAIVESSTSPDATNGAFSVASSTAQGDASRRTWATVLRGTTFILGGAAIYQAPDTRVLSALYDIEQSAAAQEAVLRLNGVQQTLNFSAPNAGTGDFLAYPAYIGARAGTSLFFNGEIYSLITRFGPNLTATEIERVERYIASQVAEETI